MELQEREPEAHFDTSFVDSIRQQGTLPPQTLSFFFCFVNEKEFLAHSVKHMPSVSFASLTYMRLLRHRTGSLRTHGLIFLAKPLSLGRLARAGAGGPERGLCRWRPADGEHRPGRPPPLLLGGRLMACCSWRGRRPLGAMQPLGPSHLLGVRPLVERQEGGWLQRLERRRRCHLAERRRGRLRVRERASCWAFRCRCALACTASASLALAATLAAAASAAVASAASLQRRLRRRRQHIEAARCAACFRLTRCAPRPHTLPACLCKPLLLAPLGMRRLDAGVQLADVLTVRRPLGDGAHAAARVES